MMVAEELVAKIRFDNANFSRDLDRSKKDVDNLQKAMQVMGNGMEQATARASSAATKLGEIFTPVVIMAGVAATALVQVGAAATGAIGNVISTGTAMTQTLASWEMQFHALTGSAEAAEAQIASSLSLKVPFQTESLLAASAALHNMGGESLNTEKNIEKLGDAAAGVQVPIEALASMTGSLYEQIRVGDPFENVLGSMQEMGVVSAFTTDEMLRLSNAGATTNQVFSYFTDSLDKFEGSMDRQTASMGGMSAALSKTFTLDSQEIAAPIFELKKRLMAMVVEFTNSNTWDEWKERLQETIGSVTETIDDLIDSAIEFKDSAAFGRMEEVFEDIKKVVSDLLPLFLGLGGAMVAMASGALPLIGSMVPAFNPIIGIIAVLIGQNEQAREAFGRLSETVRDMVREVTPGLKELADVVLGAISDILPEIVTLFGDVSDAIAPAVVSGADLGASIIKSLTPVVGVLGSIAGFLSDHEFALKGVILAWGVYKAVVIGGAITSAIAALATMIGTLAPITTAATTAMLGLQAAAGPIGIVLAAVGLLAAAYVVLGRSADDARDKNDALIQSFKDLEAATPETADVAAEDLLGSSLKIFREIETDGKSALAVINDMGLASELHDAILGDAGDQRRFKNQIEVATRLRRDFTESMEGGSFAQNGDLGEGQIEILKELSEVLGMDFNSDLDLPGMARQYGSYVSALTNVSTAWDDVSFAASDARKEIRDEEMFDAAVAAERLGEGLQQMRDYYAELEASGRGGGVGEINTDLMALANTLGTVSFEEGAKSMTEALQSILDPMTEATEHDTIQGFMDHLDKSALKLVEWRENLLTLSESDGALALLMANAGPEASALLEELMTATPEARKKMLESWNFMDDLTDAHSGTAITQALVNNAVFQEAGYANAEAYIRGFGFEPDMFNAAIESGMGPEVQTVLAGFAASGATAGEDTMQALADAISADEEKVDSAFQLLEIDPMEIQTNIVFPTMGELNAFRDYLELHIKPVVVHQTASGPHGGGFYKYADGGITENHVAQIAGASSPIRMWAEPETGGEAYIPLSMGKRGRSEGILGQVASMFGFGLTPMANGGILGFDWGSLDGIDWTEIARRQEEMFWMNQDESGEGNEQNQSGSRGGPGVPRDPDASGQRPIARGSIPAWLERANSMPSWAKELRDPNEHFLFETGQNWSNGEVELANNLRNAGHTLGLDGSFMLDGELWQLDEYMNFLAFITNKPVTEHQLADSDPRDFRSRGTYDSEYFAHTSQGEYGFYEGSGPAPRASRGLPSGYDDSSASTINVSLGTQQISTMIAKAGAKGGGLTSTLQEHV